MRPNFLIIGAGKCGTTSLWHYLSQHPEIGVSRIKEPSFFSVDETWQRGWAWYERLYDHCAGKKAIGEASNSYSATDTYPHAATRISTSLPGCKIIYSVRHPAKRTESDWMEKVRTEPVDFSDFIRTDAEYFDKNQYLKTYEIYKREVGKENILVLFYEEFSKNPGRAISSCLEFLGVDAEASLDLTARHGQSSEGRVFLPWLRGLRSSVFYQDLSIYIPSSLKSVLRPMVSRTMDISRPVWRDDDYLWFRQNFEEPSRAFLRALGRPTDYWTW